MSEELKNIAEPLTTWYREHRRMLPWRIDRAPYHVWISEIMLQQTRIEAVIGYYERFMQALPDVESLAAVEDETLLKLWEGLGYYSRARNLKKAAVKIMDEFGGVFPSRYKDLLTLPGVGEYTAGAIASMCFSEPVPAVDGNVLRVIARLTGSREDVLLPETKRETAEMLTEIMPQDPGDFNEGLMELGETICLPQTPLCDRCPLNSLCTAYAQGLTDELPVRIKTQKRRTEEKSVFLLLSDDGRIAVQKRPENGLLAGMYQLPEIAGFHTDGELMETLRAWELSPTSITCLKDAKHIFTHIIWQMKGYRVTVDHTPDRFIWITEDELKKSFPLPVAYRKILN